MAITNDFRRAWSPTAEDLGYGTGPLEEDPLNGMLSVGLYATVDDHPLPGPGPGDDVDFDLREQNCPYRRAEPSSGLRPASKMFRLVEEFSDGSVYKGDSFGDHSYINADEDRECSSHCYCRLHDQKPEAFAFIAYKTPTQLTIDFHGTDLYLELIVTIDPEEMQLEVTSQGVAVNGLSLLKHYQTLDARLNVLRSTNPTADSLSSEMALLIHGFLLDGEIFKSYGYEDLYENGLLTFDHWKEFQQVQLERDISALEEAYYAIDETDRFREEESSVPLTQADSPELRAEEIHLDVLMGDEDIELFQLGPAMPSTPGAQSSLHNPLSPETITQSTMQSSGAVARDSYGDWSPLDRGAAAGGLGGFCSLPESWLSNPFSSESLIRAAKAGHESEVRFLLDRANFDYPIFYSLIPLIEAAKAGHESVVRLLLDRGVNANYPIYCPTPSSETMKTGHEAVIRAFLDRGAPLGILGECHGSTPLAEAAKAGHESIVRLLLDRGALINYSSFWSSTPLVEATIAGHESIVQYLLYRGAAVHPVLKKYFPTSLVEAVRTGRESVVRLLLYDAAPDIQRLSLYKNFSKQYLKLKQKTKTSSTSFRDLGSRFLVRREAWAHGIRTLRRLCNGEPPRTLDDAIAFLCVSRAISGTLDNGGDCDYTNQFLQDLDRWQILFTSDTAALTAYREAARRMWDVVLDENLPCSEQASKLETLTYFQALASTLVHQANGFLGLRSASDKGLESSQERWRLRKVGTIQTGERSPPPSEPQTEPFHTIDPKPPDLPGQTKRHLLRQEINEDNSSANISPIVVVLMAGAIFMIVVLFLTRQRNASARVGCYSAIALRSRESRRLDITHATDNIVDRLRQRAPGHTHAITKLGTRLSRVLKSGTITRFSELKKVLADYNSSNALGRAELETQTIKQQTQEACEYYDPVYTLQERYRTLEAYLNLQSHPSIVPAPVRVPTSNPPAARQFYFHPIQTEPATKSKTPRPATSPQTPQSQKPTSPNPRRPFCQPCQRAFSSRTNYHKHQRDKHDGLRFPCRHCRNHYSRAAYRDVHEREKHRNF